MLIDNYGIRSLCFQPELSWRWLGCLQQLRRRPRSPHEVLQFEFHARQPLVALVVSLCYNIDISVNNIATFVRHICHSFILSELNVQRLEARHTLVVAVIHVGVGIELGGRDLPWDINLLFKGKRALLQRALLVDLLQRITQALVPLDKRNVPGLDSQEDI